MVEGLQEKENEKNHKYEEKEQIKVERKENKQTKDEIKRKQGLLER